MDPMDTFLKHIDALRRGKKKHWLTTKGPGILLPHTIPWDYTPLEIRNIIDSKASCSFIRSIRENPLGGVFVNPPTLHVKKSTIHALVKNTSFDGY